MEFFIGQIVQFGFNYAPKGFAIADGQLFPISGNESLFSLLGDSYGGDGRTNFRVPNLNGGDSETKHLPGTPLNCICIEGMYPARS